MIKLSHKITSISLLLKFQYMNSAIAIRRFFFSSSSSSFSVALCWFQTSLPLCRVIIACCFRAAALSGNAALVLSSSGIAPELNRIQLSAICRGGQSGKVIDLLAWCCLPLGHLSAASGACAVEQISSSKRQCGKLVWNQHYSDFTCLKCVKPLLHVVINAAVSVTDFLTILSRGQVWSRYILFAKNAMSFTLHQVLNIVLILRHN